MKFVLVVVAILAVIVVLVALASAIGRATFRRRAGREIMEMFEQGRGTASAVVTEEDLARLPEPVQRWLRYSGVVGKARTQFVRLKYAGTFKMDAGQPWLPVQAEKYYTIDPPSSVMLMTARMAPLLTVTARDKFYQDHGNMLVKLLSLVTLADQSGPDMDQSTAALWLQEICWFPDAALSDYIEWEAIDANSALATMTHPGQTVTGVFTFDEDGVLINFEAERYRSGGGETSLDTYLALYDAYGEFHGVRLPVGGEGIWRLSSGEEFSYIRLTEIEAIEYNNPTLW